MNILVIDDQQDLCELIEAFILRDTNFTCKVVNSIVEANTITNEMYFDILLTDLLLSDSKSTGDLFALKYQLENPDTKIFLMSGSKDVFPTQYLKYIKRYEKPIKFSELLNDFSEVENDMSNNNDSNSVTRAELNGMGERLSQTQLKTVVNESNINHNDESIKALFKLSGENSKSIKTVSDKLNNLTGKVTVAVAIVIVVIQVVFKYVPAPQSHTQMHTIHTTKK